jgi:hypothetical protein
MKIIVVVLFVGLLISCSKMKQLAQCHQADSQYLTTKVTGSSANDLLPDVDFLYGC